MADRRDVTTPPPKSPAPGSIPRSSSLPRIANSKLFLPLQNEGSAISTRGQHLPSLFNRRPSTVRSSERGRRGSISEDEEDVRLRPGGEQRAKGEEKGQQKAFHDRRSLKTERLVRMLRLFTRRWLWPAICCNNRASGGGRSSRNPIRSITSARSAPERTTAARARSAR